MYITMLLNVYIETPQAQCDKHKGDSYGCFERRIYVVPEKFQESA